MITDYGNFTYSDSQMIPAIIMQMMCYELPLNANNTEAI